MPLTKLQFRPGINRDTTNYANEGGWYECDKVRFYSGYPQKLGGWVKYSALYFIGVCRQMWNWFTTYSDDFLAIGTDKKLYIETGANFYDVTPLRDTSAAGTVKYVLSTLSSPNSIVVYDPNNDVEVGDYVTLFGATGATDTNITAEVVNQNYRVHFVFSDNSYGVVPKNPATGESLIISGTGAELLYDDFTADDVTDTITFTGSFRTTPYTPVNGDILYISAESGELPSGLSDETRYFVVNASGNSCQLALTSGGAPVDIGTIPVFYNFYIAYLGGGNAMGADYEITTGFSISTAGYGWSTGAWSGTTGLSPEGTFTVTIASPAVLTFATYTPANNDAVVLSTTGALPTGLTAGIGYYVINASGSTCNLSLTLGGAAINTSGSQSGTHSVSLIEAPTGWDTSSDTPIFLPQRDWWFDNFNNSLYANIRSSQVGIGGPIYYWDRQATASPTTSLNTRAVLLSSVAGADSVPTTVGQILVSQNDGHLLAFGAQPFDGSSTDYDPLLIRWASQDEPYFWNPAGTTPNGLPTSASFLRVSRGSRIVRALPTRQEIVVLTDTHVYSLQFLGTVEIFGLQELSDNISIISPRAVIAANNIVFWMGTDKFYVYDGRVQVLPCTIREHIFKNINLAQNDQIICGTNESYNEVWWFYCSADSDEIDSYAIYNYLEQIWYYGTMQRTAWLDKAASGKPLACKYGYVNVIKKDLVATALLQAALSREPARTLFRLTTIDGRPLGDIDNTGTVTSSDALIYLKYAEGRTDITAAQLSWIENVLNPYMLAAPNTYAAYIESVEGVSQLYTHESGLNDDTEPMVSYIQSSDFDIGDGEKFMLTRRIIPDVNFVSSTADSPEVDLTIRPRNWPGSNFTNDPSDTQRVIQTSVNQYTNQVFVRARARQLAVKVASDDLNVFWQLGALRLDAREDGKQ
jgi:hypothetical protein